MRKRSNRAPPKLEAALAAAKQSFKEVFGRSPRKGDRILLAGFRYSLTDIRREQRKAFESAGSPKHLVYATEKTDRFVTKENWNLLSPEDQVEWQEAVDEYLEAQANGIDLLAEPDTELTRAIANLRRCIDDAVVHLGSYVDRAPMATKRDLPIFCQYLMIVKCYWHLKCISDKWDNISKVEISAIVRSLYECTLLIGMMIRNPEYSQALEAQAFSGQSPYPYRTKKDGSPDFSTIVSEKDGSSFPARTSFRQCALSLGQSHVDFFDVLYPMLSDQVHFDLRQMIELYVSSQSFLMWDDGDVLITSLISSVASIYLFSSLLFSPGLQKLVKRDAGYIGQRIAEALDDFLKALEAEKLYSEQFDIVLSSLGNLEWDSR